MSLYATFFENTRMPMTSHNRTYNVETTGFTKQQTTKAVQKNRLKRKRDDKRRDVMTVTKSDFSHANYFENTRTLMTLRNWTRNVNTTRRKSQESHIALHTQKNRLKRNRQDQVNATVNVFDEDDVQKSMEKTAKSLAESEQKLLTKLKRRRPNNQPFPLGPGKNLFDEQSGMENPTSELFPTSQQSENMKDVDQLLEKDAFLENVTQVVQHIIRPISESDDGGTQTAMSKEAITIQQRRLLKHPLISEVYSADFMQLWLREPNPKTNERGCARGRACAGAVFFMAHIQEGKRAPELREFLHFHDRMNFYQYNQLPQKQNWCLLCILYNVSVAWSHVACAMESSDYAEQHCVFENLFEIPGEIIKELALSNPPDQYFGLPGPVALFLPGMFKPVKYRGSKDLLALEFVSECLVPTTRKPVSSHFR